MDGLFKKYDVAFEQNHRIKRVEDLLYDMVSEVCSAIDDELYELLEMVEDGEHSPDEVLKKIQEIRKKIY